MADAGTPLSRFLALPAGPAIAFLASAACLLGGVAMIIAPTIAQPDGLGDRFAAHGALTAYWLALLAVGLLLERWRRANPDGIGAWLLLALVAVAATITLDVIAVDAPRAALALGAGGLALAVGMYRLVVGRVLDRGGAVFALGLALLAAQDALTPAALALHANLATPPSDEIGAWRWSFVLALAGLALLLAAAFRFAPERDATLPVVRRAGLRWVLALVVVAASGVHQWSLDHIHQLALGARDWLPAAGLAALLLNELRRRAWGEHVPLDRAAMLLAPAWAVACALAAPRDAAAHWSAPTDLVLIAGTCAWIAALGERRDALLGAAAGAIAAAATWRGGVGIDPAAMLLAGAAAVAASAIVRRRPAEALAAALLAETALALVPPLRHALGAGTAIEAWVAVVGATTLAAACAWPRSLARLSLPAAIALLIGLCWLDPTPHAASAIAICLAVLAAAAWRLRSPRPLLPLAVPLCRALPLLIPDNKGWLAVATAFALLAIGAAIGRARARAHAAAPSA